ncbi:MAG: TetR/AcrR family transcriptional regulator [Clostridiales Family XIII bacterium]|jgi:AcrR family transcriptional regulator|nr:TetR/AcrR family transcriptional regulator [Clostridiales Family XIII bacterium]
MEKERKPRDEDLRVVKTKEAIRQSFRKLIADMPYADITVAELIARAQINRKTFYLHYKDMDALLAEQQSEIAERFAARISRYKAVDDIPSIIREVFERYSEQVGIDERIISCDPNMNGLRKTMERIWELNSECVDNLGEFDEHTRGVITTFLVSSIISIYRYWRRSGRQPDLAEVIGISSNLICNGVNGIV